MPHPERDGRPITDSEPPLSARDLLVELAKVKGAIRRLRKSYPATGAERLEADGLRDST